MKRLTVLALASCAAALLVLSGCSGQDPAVAGAALAARSSYEHVEGLALLGVEALANPAAAAALGRQPITEGFAALERRTVERHGETLDDLVALASGTLDPDKPVTPTPVDLPPGDGGDRAGEGAGP